MKKHILTIVSLLALGFTSIQAQTYNMKISKTNGEEVVIAADDIKEIVFEAEQEDEPEKTPYELWEGDWTFTAQGVYEDYVIRDIRISLPEKSSEEYGKYLYVSAPDFVQDSGNVWACSWKMKYNYDESTQGGTVVMEIDKNPIGAVNATKNFFFQLDDMPNSDNFIDGNYIINWSVANINNGANNRAADRSQNLYLLIGEGETFTTLTSQWEVIGDIRLKKK